MQYRTLEGTPQLGKLTHSKRTITELREILKDVKLTSVLVSDVAGTLGIFDQTSYSLPLVPRIEIRRTISPEMKASSRGCDDHLTIPSPRAQKLYSLKLKK